MHKITVGVFEHLEITSPIDVDQRVSYTQRILSGAALENNRLVLVECKQLEKELAGYK